MSIDAIVGGQWGDEGKGKIVDLLSKNVNIVARYQGGANAGHTVYRGDNKIVLHQIPKSLPSLSLFFAHPNNQPWRHYRYNRLNPEKGSVCLVRIH